jgi:hypothetical protein
MIGGEITDVNSIRWNVEEFGTNLEEIVRAQRRWGVQLLPFTTCFSVQMLRRLNGSGRGFDVS